MTEAALPAERDAEKPAPEGDSDEDILKEARDRYQACISAESDNRTAALDDLRFLAGEQWPAVAKQQRVNEGRPCLTVNNLPTFLHQITNEQRQNKRSIHVHPVDDKADIETAEVIQGLTRHVEYDSNADVAATTAVNSAAAIGFGYLRLVTEYESETSFDQKIMFKRIRNALSVHIDPMSQEPDASDQKYCFIDSLELRSEFEKEHPKAKATNADLIGQAPYAGWFTKETVLVCEYYRLKLTPAVVCQLIDGSVGWKDELPKEQIPFIKRERKSAKRSVEWFKLTGSDVLERTEIKCKWIPVFPVYGDEIDIEGKVIRSGMIRNAKDPCQMYNFAVTSATEEVTLRPKTPFIGAVGQFETSKPQWQSANQRSYAFIEYDPVTVDGVIAPAPARQPMADVPVGMLSLMLHARDNVKATTGLFDSSLGAKGTATSGIQEREQQAQGDVANFHYSDNLNITYRHIGRCLVSMYPHYYDGARTVRILGEDETAEPVQINQQVEQKNPKTGAIETVMHDLTIGEYDVTVSSGPSYSTKRQEAAEFMTDAMQAAKDPAAASVLTYLAIKNQDLAGAEEATAMLKKLLPPGVVEPEEGEEPMVNTPHGPMPISKVGELIQQMGQALQNASQQMEQADIAGKQAEAIKEQNRQEELRIKDKEAETKRYEAETNRMTADAALLTAQTASTTAGTEATTADANVLSVAQAAAREAVGIILSTHPAELPPEVHALAQQPPKLPPEPIPQQPPEQPAPPI